MDRISLIDHVKNEVVLHRVKEERNILPTVKIRLTRLVISYVGTAFLNTLLRGRKGEGYEWQEGEVEEVSSYWMT
jgi:hypothetical protein